ncbi:MAG: lamin tail domain-containing protein [Candidatus Promineifilaceae bacterium]|nr:lamin tail domain-containing protein [Candidatus Promineifilaceae bacterium]
MASLVDRAREPLSEAVRQCRGPLKGSSGFNKILVLVLPLVLACFGCAAPPEAEQAPETATVAEVEVEEAPTEEPADTAAATKAVNPTNTPEPTTTLAPTDTATKEPTSTPSPRPTNTPLPQPTNTPLPEPTNTPLPQPTNPPATATSPPAPSGAQVLITAVNKRDEYVDLVNNGGQAADMNGWILRSEKGNQDCRLAFVLQPGQGIRVWARAEDAGQGGFNCQFGSNIWNNSDPDPAVLIDTEGQVVDRFP